VQFDTAVNGLVKNLMVTFPGLLRLEIHRPLDMDVGARPIYQIYNMAFDDVEAMNAALDSPVRKSIHAEMDKILPFFEGKIVHYVWSVD
jgi:antibiotic biosynthesis monooxygenase (ABM) superfamily enzyme